MSDIKNHNLKNLKECDFFPDDYIDIYRNDYEELIEKESDKINKNIKELNKKGYSLKFIENIIMAKYNLAIDHYKK